MGLTKPQTAALIQAVSTKDYWQTPEAIDRRADARAGEWVTITFIEGGTMSVFTKAPIVWTAPQEH